MESSYLKRNTYIKEIGKLACKPISTLIKPNHKLETAEEYATVDKDMYQTLVEKFIYLSHTRPDIAYAINVISQFMHSQKEVHLQATYRVLHNLKRSPKKGIIFKKSDKLLSKRIQM